MQGRGRQNGKRCRVDIRSQFAAVARGADASLENFIERIEALCESAADCRISDCFGQRGAGREATPGAAACWFSVLLILLNWKTATPVDLTKWPAVQDYYQRLKQRPSIARALTEEHALYAAEQARHKAA